MLPGAYAREADDLAGGDCVQPDNDSPESIIEAIKQWVIELDAETGRINAAREAMPPPIDRAATAIRLKPHRRPSPPASDERRSKRRQKPAAAADD